MIEELETKRIDELISTFKDVFSKTNISNDLTMNPFSKYYLYIENGNIVAFIHFDIIYERAELIQINVLENFQNKHLASKLIDYMINECKKNNVKNITLEVNTTNKKAIHLYQKFGFKNVAVRKAYYDGIDGILMEKEMI